MPVTTTPVTTGRDEETVTTPPAPVSVLPTISSVEEPNERTAMLDDFNSVDVGDDDALDVRDRSSFTHHRSHVRHRIDRPLGAVARDGRDDRVGRRVALSTHTERMDGWMVGRMDEWMDE